MSYNFLHILIFLLIIQQNGFANDNTKTDKWENDLLKIYNGTVVYTSSELLKMNDELDHSNIIERSLWGMMVIQTSFINPEESISLNEIHQALSSLFQKNLKISNKKNTAKEQYYAGRFTFYLLGYSTFYKIPKASFHDIYIQYRTLLSSVIYKNQGYINNANILIADGLSRPTDFNTNNWNTFILKSTDNNILSSVPTEFQYRAYLAKARILIKTNRIKEAQILIKNAIAIFPNGAAEAIILNNSI
ncbi:MAG: hypothetical protein KFW21_06380 [Spirochaetota bacterium]|nr:hypothetical protein [Spirochaetota bacterium]